MTTTDAHFTLTIDLGNAQMQNRHNVADALYHVAKRLDNENHLRGSSILDANGNKVGSFRFSDDYYVHRV